ncbi:hypothetical protein CONCODRAFT_21054 [Conidiobolus coronatus NRRL 28638]|uniref:Uncharacterized protein n=1 Tax=Conidiobolus coronatus (strain ATCC 28846 / CBS 209.66 / NRRL 28638) TaxID=796925 RepID=A0A137NPJ3_CONC2|nr:hypothetical protein CONCODRAFT_21054 [Conidiobolus coronatus NRRL 28638]|eukprot:KXN64660.1 hypothetical protein CONCODRAFT_21054 [Conidiobolus coronatus NRRL 28638]
MSLNGLYIVFGILGVLYIASMIICIVDLCYIRFFFKISSTVYESKDYLAKLESNVESSETFENIRSPPGSFIVSLILSIIRLYLNRKRMPNSSYRNRRMLDNDHTDIEIIVDELYSSRDPSPPPKYRLSIPPPAYKP